MSAVDQPCADGCVGGFLDEDGALLAQGVDDMPVVHDFVPHVDGLFESVECPLDDLDGAIDAGTEASRAGKQDFHWSER